MTTAKDCKILIKAILEGLVQLGEGHGSANAAEYETGGQRLFLQTADGAARRAPSRGTLCHSLDEKEQM